jgi:hypothetical protein
MCMYIYNIYMYISPTLLKDLPSINFAPCDQYLSNILCIILFWLSVYQWKLKLYTNGEKNYNNSLESQDILYFICILAINTMTSRIMYKFNSISCKGEMLAGERKGNQELKLKMWYKISESWRRDFSPTYFLLEGLWWVLNDTNVYNLWLICEAK